MPNWCYNTEIIVGPAEEVQNLYNKIILWTSSAWVEKHSCHTDFGNGWLGHVVKGAGLPEHSRQYPNGLRCRGSFLSIDPCYDILNGITMEKAFTFYTETAWGPFPETWNEILYKMAPHCKYYFFAEESGMAIYATNDLNKFYFKDDYYLDFYISNTEAIPKIFKRIEHYDLNSDRFYSAEYMMKILQELFCVNTTDVKALVDRFNKMDFGDDNYCSIHEIERISA